MMKHGTRYPIIRCLDPDCIKCHCEECNWTRHNQIGGVEVGRRDDTNEIVGVRLVFGVMQIFPALKVTVVQPPEGMM